MSFDSEDSEIYYIAEENDDSHSLTSQSEYYASRLSVARGKFGAQVLPLKP